MQASGPSYFWRCYACLAATFASDRDYAEKTRIQHHKDFGHTTHACYWWEECDNGCASSLSEIV